MHMVHLLPAGEAEDEEKLRVLWRSGLWQAQDDVWPRLVSSCLVGNRQLSSSACRVNRGRERGPSSFTSAWEEDPQRAELPNS